MSTSALSQSVRQLEARLNITLLTRSSRTVALTDAGRRLLENAGPAVEQALDAIKNVSAKPGEVTERIVDAMSATGLERPIFISSMEHLRRGAGQGYRSNLDPYR